MAAFANASLPKPAVDGVSEALHDFEHPYEHVVFLAVRVFFLCQLKNLLWLLVPWLLHELKAWRAPASVDRLLDKRVSNRIFRRVRLDSVGSEQNTPLHSASLVSPLQDVGVPQLVLPPAASSAASHVDDSSLLHVFSFLDGPDLAHAQQVCRSWMRIASRIKLWDRLEQTARRELAAVHAAIELPTALPPALVRPLSLPHLPDTDTDTDLDLRAAADREVQRIVSPHSTPSLPPVQTRTLSAPVLEPTVCARGVLAMLRSQSYSGAKTRYVDALRQLRAERVPVLVRPHSVLGVSSSQLAEALDERKPFSGRHCLAAVKKACGELTAAQVVWALCVCVVVGCFVTFGGTVASFALQITSHLLRGLPLVKMFMYLWVLLAPGPVRTKEVRQFAVKMLAAWGCLLFLVENAFQALAIHTPFLHYPLIFSKNIFRIFPAVCAVSDLLYAHRRLPPHLYILQRAPRHARDYLLAVLLWLFFVVAIEGVYILVRAETDWLWHVWGLSRLPLQSALRLVPFLLFLATLITASRDCLRAGRSPQQRREALGLSRLPSSSTSNWKTSVVWGAVLLASEAVFAAFRIETPLFQLKLTVRIGMSLALHLCRAVAPLVAVWTMLGLVEDFFPPSKPTAHDVFASMGMPTVPDGEAKGVFEGRLQRLAHRVWRVRPHDLPKLCYHTLLLPAVKCLSFFRASAAVILGVLCSELTFRVLGLHTPYWAAVWRALLSTLHLHVVPVVPVLATWTIVRNFYPARCCRVQPLPAFCVACLPCLAGGLARARATWGAFRRTAPRILTPFFAPLLHPPSSPPVQHPPQRKEAVVCVVGLPPQLPAFVGVSTPLIRAVEPKRNSGVLWRWRQFLQNRGVARRFYPRVVLVASIAVVLAALVDTVRARSHMRLPCVLWFVLWLRSA